VHKRLTTILLSVVVGLTACKRGQKPVATTGELSAGEYEVLSACVADLFSDQKVKERGGTRIVKIVMLNMTASGDDHPPRDENGQPFPWEKTAERLRKNAPALQQTTIDAFRKANAQQAFARRSFQFPIDYEIITSDQLESFFKTHGYSWPAYYKQYPGSNGILTWSRAGFNADGTQALFYFANHCGELCGGGSYVVMEKRSGRWVIEKEIEMWIS